MVIEGMNYNCYYRAEEEATARAKAEKQCRDLSAQVSELQDDLESEKDAKAKVEKMRKHLNEVSIVYY